MAAARQLTAGLDVLSKVFDVLRSTCSDTELRACLALPGRAGTGCKERIPAPKLPHSTSQPTCGEAKRWASGLRRCRWGGWHGGSAGGAATWDGQFCCCGGRRSLGNIPSAGATCQRHPGRHLLDLHRTGRRGGFRI